MTTMKETVIKYLTYCDACDKYYMDGRMPDGNMTCPSGTTTVVPVEMTDLGRLLDASREGVRFVEGLVVRVRGGKA